MRTVQQDTDKTPDLAAEVAQLRRQVDALTRFVKLYEELPPAPAMPQPPVLRLVRSA